METLIGLLIGALIAGAYLLGRDHELRTAQGRTINPVKQVQQHFENKDALKKISELDRQMEAIIAYDGPPKQFDENGRRLTIEEE